MDREDQLRLEALRLAVAQWKDFPSGDVVKAAKEYYEFLKGTQQ